MNCKHCGRWSGLFGNEHMDCAALAAKGMTASQEVANSDAKSRSAQVTMGFSFNLRTEFPHGPLSPLMIERVIGWNAIELSVAQEVGDCILGLVRDGASDRDFWKWCVSEKSPGSIKGLRKSWAELLFNSVAAHTCSADRRSQLLTTTSVLPFWQLSCVTQSCIGHRSLDGFTARFDDAAWREIYPPNGWACGCSVVPLMASDVAGAPSTIADVSEALRAKCTEWIDIPPKGFPLPF